MEKGKTTVSLSSLKARSDFLNNKDASGTMVDKKSVGQDIIMSC